MTAPQPMPSAEPPPTVLVVEDEVLIRLAVAQYLRDCGWVVLEAGDAEEALTILQAADVRVDLVFTDVQMPRALDGFGLARWIRAHRPEVRVLLTSGAPAAMAAKAGDLCG
ncbi:MAG TPA: response regulator, partial [Thermoanaerobaculia bacterium]|nr:response regulator [Thermoanaerobaculia bacterium]